MVSASPYVQQVQPAAWSGQPVVYANGTINQPGYPNPPGYVGQHPYMGQPWYPNQPVPYSHQPMPAAGLSLEQKKLGENYQADATAGPTEPKSCPGCGHETAQYCSHCGVHLA
eukprot:TRINITY_DN10170_c0_g1_i1.p2 TRINITY_DN10170_c0_g1~~TRINITY_DN10170_c0_g1_i1.p2  ORF type:complete len:113 (+),score=12.09 TRINITY_DN10170_c0_g1_i1:932-1270(+)